MVSKTKVKKRMDYVFANPQFGEEIRQNLITTKGFHEGDSCPCPDCNSTLQKKRDGYTKIVDNKLVAVDFDVFFCPACGYQGRNTSEEASP